MGEGDILVIYFTKVPSELGFLIVINILTSETVVITSDTSLIPWELAQICQAGSEVPSANIYQDELPKRVVIITYWDKRDIFLKNVLITIQLKILVLQWRTKSGNHQMVIKLQLVILIWGLVFLGLRIGDFPNPKNINSKSMFSNWSFYHQLVISTFSSLYLSWTTNPDPCSLTLFFKLTAPHFGSKEVFRVHFDLYAPEYLLFTNIVRKHKFRCFTEMYNF